MDKRQQSLIGVNAWMVEKELDLFDPTRDPAFTKDSVSYAKVIEL